MFNHLNQSAEDFYTQLADHIATRIKPGSVLDIRCGAGQLVAQLRLRGIDSYGLQFSEDAREEFLPGVKEYCSIVSSEKLITEKYDLVICLEATNLFDQVESAIFIQNICSISDEILFSSNPLDILDVSGSQIIQPGYWAVFFAEYGFVRKPGQQFSTILPWGIHFHRSALEISKIAREYENRLWKHRFENLARREQSITLQEELAFPYRNQEMLYTLKQEKAQITQEKNELYHHYLTLINSRSWQFMRSIHNIRHKLIPLGSRRERFMYKTISTILHPLSGRGRTLNIQPVAERPDVQPYTGSVDIIICVHNALDDVRTCLNSVVTHKTPPANIILVDDGSDKETADYLRQFSAEYDCQFIRNQEAKGYTLAANQGLRASSADFAVLLNSDTVVTPQWLDRMITCADSDPEIGMVGPLSNTASWQSIPKIESNGDWADNPLPHNLSIDEMASLVATNSGRVYPEMKFLNGFCLLIRRALIKKIGVFDEKVFGAGYGEENDYCLRARKAGWKLALADDTYIYHAQSKSYSSERRKALSDRAGKALVEKHGSEIVDEGVQYSLTSPVLQGIRYRSEHYFNLWELLKQGEERFSGKRVLFILPVKNAGGGSNVVISEARAMRKMGTDVRIFNLDGNRREFESSNHSMDIPMVYGNITDIPSVASDYDAVIATFNPSVAWMAPARQINPNIRFGYYVQDFEPYFYPEDSEDYKYALESYTLIPEMVLFCKTEWVRGVVLKNTGINPKNVGISIDTRYYRPRTRQLAKSYTSQIRIGAMIRPESIYRAPELTMRVLKRADKTYGARIIPMIFGMNIQNVAFKDLPTDFNWKAAGLLNPAQVAAFMNEIDIFVDFSTHQAMGLSALEAMASGVAVILPSRGGAKEFAIHEENSLVIDTSDEENCWGALKRLIDNHELRIRLQQNALRDVCRYYPDISAYKTLNAIFGHDQIIQTSQDRKS